MSSVIKNYIQIIGEFLLSKSIDHDSVRIVTDDIEGRLVSVISRWNDKDFRTTILLPCLEEAMYYKPNKNIEIRSLVVFAIRNSLLEDLHSEQSFDTRLSKYKGILGENDMKVITSEAVRYFSDFDLTKVENQPITTENVLFDRLPGRYPIAWSALNHLSRCSQVTLTNKFPPQKSNKTVLLERLEQNEVTSQVVVQSGIDPTINKELSQILGAIQEGEMPLFFSDSFKFITRNIEKLLYVLEVVLRNNKSFVTHNFYIQNGFVARRRVLLKPAHYTSEVHKKFGEKIGLVKDHKRVLDMILKQLR